MKIRRLALLVLCTCLRTAAAAEPLPDYVRYAEDSRSARLEIAIKSFSMPSGQKVDLIAVAHMADAAYYKLLNERFAAYDAVLFELVGDPTPLMRNAPATDAKHQPGNGLGFIQQAAGEYLDLTFQLDAIDYTRKNMVHADASTEEFERMQQQRGETMMTLFVRAMQAQAGGGMNRAADELDTFALIRILTSTDATAEFKKALAKTLDQLETATAALEGKDGSAVLSGRNEVALKKLKEVLAQPKQRRVALFYGGAHMPGIEAALREDLKAKPSGEEWLAAWTMPKPPSGNGARVGTEHAEQR